MSKDLELEKAKALALGAFLPDEENEQESRRVASGRKNFAPTLEDMEKARAEVEPTTGEALAAGWVQGAPFLKDASAAYDAIAESMEEDNFSFDKAHSLYKSKLEEANKGLKAAEEHSPWAFAAGDIAGTAASFAAGGAALKAAGAGKVLTDLGIGVVSGAGVGAASQLSKSEDRGISDVAAGAVMGGASEFGGHYLMKGVKKGGKYLLDKADDIGAKAVKKILGLDTVGSKQQYNKHLKMTKQKEGDFLEDILTQKMDDTGETVINFRETPERMLDKIDLKKSTLGDNISKTYKQIDEKYGIEIDLTELKNSLMDDVVTPFKLSDDPGTQEVGEELTKYISSIGRKTKSFKKEVTEEGTKIIEDVIQEDKWTLQRTHKLQKDIRKRIQSIFKARGMDATMAKEQQRKVASSLGKHMDEVLDFVSSDADDAIGQVRKLRKQYGNISTIGESIESALYRQKDDPMALLKEVVGFRSMIISGAAASAVGPVGLLAGPALDRVLRSPKTPLYLSQGLQKIGEVVNVAPTGRIATKINSAALMSNDKFEKAVYGIIGEINLKSSPIARNSEDVVAKQEDIRNVLKEYAPDTVEDFEEALIEGKEATNAFMDGMSKAPYAKAFFEPGVGFDGKVYTPEDAAQLEEQLKKSDIPAAQRQTMLQNLRETGTIPNFDAVVRPIPQPHVPRAKKIHNY